MLRISVISCVILMGQANAGDLNHTLHIMKNQQGWVIVSEKPAKPQITVDLVPILEVACPLIADDDAQPLTPEERFQNAVALLQVERGAAVPVKSEQSLDLTLAKPLRVVSSDIEVPPPTVLRQPISLDSPTSRAAGPPLRYAEFRKPLRLTTPPHMAANLASPTGTTVTFSSQGAAALQALTGKGLSDFQLIAATMCRWTPGESFSFGLVTQLANSIGIQTISKETGTAIVQRRVDLNWHNLFPFLIKEGSITALSVMTSGVWRPGRIAVFATVLGHESADHLPALFGRGAPNPDPYLRGSASSVDKIDLAPGECKEAQFSGVYAGPKTSFVTDRLQLLP